MQSGAADADSVVMQILLAKNSIVHIVCCR